MIIKEPLLEIYVRESYKVMFQYATNKKLYSIEWEKIY